MHAAPALTAARAREAWLAREPGPSANMDLTPAENAYVRRVWDTMGGDSSWISAFFEVMRGRGEARLTGTL